MSRPEESEIWTDEYQGQFGRDIASAAMKNAMYEREMREANRSIQIAISSLILGFGFSLVAIALGTSGNLLAFIVPLFIAFCFACAARYFDRKSEYHSYIAKQWLDPK